MGDSRNAKAYATTRLRNEAGELLEQKKREPDPEVRREMAQRAGLLDRTLLRCSTWLQSNRGPTRSGSIVRLRKAPPRGWS
jgi:hypothetical protein